MSKITVEEILQKVNAIPAFPATVIKSRLPTKYYENSGVLNLSRPQPIL